ncbi:DegT/DnrJ/EryC1/StrS family aminotransferase [Fluviispira sanaruensis]|uniref:DegT/DnrJ/EryC1/StrS family aminotransferase n=1 Tax=Fluviispira sanaruensis TaxID=2493639 RepID=A0A4P2VL86_FLUSA|nr:DegT/DnrJ/EryC1/StrS family aminotransferase [Fluviispira sanaruensis]BBH54076.1 DegT/DnrJ/EryC1/StrS family aminotransferase [Fluviispira sanaruensis]
MPGYEIIGEEELKNIQEIFSQSSGVLFAHGFPNQRGGRYRVREFEKQLAENFSSEYCQVVSSRTAAEFVALKAMGIQPGDEVITQAFTFVATIEGIIECGATPIVVDIDETLNMCPIALEKAITSKTKCIIPVYMLGNPARMDEIMKISSKYNIPVMEDACEALGATYKNKSVGTIGHCGIFSLDFGKTITTGEGGFILTQNSELYNLMAEYHDHGHQNLQNVSRGCDTARISGFNFRMTEMQAAVGSAQLLKLSYILQKNRANKRRLKSNLTESISNSVEFREIISPEGELADTLMLFLPNAGTAAKVVALLKEDGIGTKNVPDAMNWHFSKNWHHIWKFHPIYKDCYQEIWRKSDNLLSKCISIPIMVKSFESEIDLVSDKIIKAIRNFI